MRIVACLLVCCAAASAQGKGPRPDKNGGPKVGEDAPDFVLKTLDGESDVKLSTHEGEKPVVLLFASYT